MKKLNIVLTVLFGLAAFSAQADVANADKHIITGKAIRPLSPAVNDKRFNDIEKVKGKLNRKLLRINCIKLIPMFHVKHVSQ